MRQLIRGATYQWRWLYLLIGLGIGFVAGYCTNQAVVMTKAAFRVVS